MNQKYLNLAKRMALDHDYDPLLDFRLCAILVKGGSILSIGFNKKATNSFVEFFADKAKGVGRDYCLSTHAEMDAILKAKKRKNKNLKGGKIYIARIKKASGIGMARPCPICQLVLYSHGVSKAIYSIRDNEYGVMKIVNPLD